MYVSKHYTCEEVDQRLLQGYYDDFVSAGFVGTLKEFQQFVLSIKDKVNTTELQDAKDEISDKIQDVVDQFDEKLEAQKVTKVSQLENDSQYATIDEVKDAINNLVDGSVDALDTLKELAEALDNDADFAGTMTRKLQELKDAIDAETTRAKEAEAKLEASINSTNSELASKVKELSGVITNTYNRLDEKVDTVTQTISALQKEFRDFGTEVNNTLAANKESLEAEINAEAEARKSGDEDNATLVSEEAERAKAEETTLNNKIDTLSQAQTDYQTGIDNKILSIKQEVSDESIKRQQGDSNLETKLNEEAIARANSDTSIKEQVANEVSNRTDADTRLSNRITDEVSNRTLADHTLQDNIDAEETARTQADKDLESKITNLTTTVNSGNSNLEDKINQEIQDRKDADDTKVDKVEGKGLSEEDFTTYLKTKLEAIEYGANKITQVSQLINDSGYQTADDVSAAISAVIDSAPDALNTLKELAEALGNDPNYAATISKQLASLATQLNQEIQDRKDADSAISVDLASKYAELLSKINAAETTLTNSIQTLSTQLASVSTMASEAKSTATEVSGKLEGYNIPQLSAKVEQVEETLDDLDTDIDDKITAANKELTDRVVTAETNINANVSRIQDNLSLIQELQAQLKNVNSEIDRAVATETELRQAADSVLQSKIDSLALQVNSEATLREQADNVLTANLSKEETARIQAIEDIKSLVEKETEERKSNDDSIKETVSDIDARVKSLEGKSSESWEVTGYGTVYNLDGLVLASNSNLSIIGNVSVDSVRAYDWNTGLIIPNYFMSISGGVKINLPEYPDGLDGVIIELHYRSNV